MLYLARGVVEQFYYQEGDCVLNSETFIIHLSTVMKRAKAIYSLNEKVSSVTIGESVPKTINNHLEVFIGQDSLSLAVKTKKALKHI